MKGIQKKLKVFIITTILCLTSTLAIQDQRTNVAASELGGDSSFMLVYRRQKPGIPLRIFHRFFKRLCIGMGGMRVMQ